MDGADLITTLALDVQPGEAVLDMDNSTGVEALCLLQSLKPSILVCNTNENIKNLFRDYLFDFSPSWKNILKLISFNYNYKENQNFFDKVIFEIELHTIAL